MQIPLQRTSATGAAPCSEVVHGDAEDVTRRLDVLRSQGWSPRAVSRLADATWVVQLQPRD